MARLNNPFVVYGYKGAEYFCDRQKETEKMISSLHNERNITLVAPRRMGKTGLIHHVFHQMEEQYDGVKCFYLDIFATKNLEQMVQLMASEIIGKLDTVSQSALRKVQEFFSSWRPTLTIDELTGIPSFSLDLKPSEGKESLKRIFEYLKQSGKRCYIAIDEFQQILSYPEDGVEAMIRSYIQFLPNVYFVFSGSQQHLMQEMFLSANRPFFQSSLVLSLPCIGEQVYREFANRTWIIYLSANDIFKTSKERWTKYGLGSDTMKDCYTYTRSISLQVTYNFNAKRSKYKGTGAGNAEKSRL